MTTEMRALAELSYPVLESLKPEQWHAPTSSSRWCVKDIIAHLLDGNVRRLSSQRDGYASPNLRPEVNGYTDLVGFLNQLNDDWTRASYRLSPGLLLELLRFTDAKLLDFLESLDPFGRAPFPVAWAGEEHSANWFDVAREYTEKWHHQMQIREAVGHPLAPLNESPYLPSAIDIFLRGLPHHFSGVQAPANTRLTIQLSDSDAPSWSLVRRDDNWILFREGADAREDARACVSLSGITAWKILTKRCPISDLKELFPDLRPQGDSLLTDHFLSAVSMMA